MTIETKIHSLFSTDRISARREIVELFLEENFGTGNGDFASKYTYVVEAYQNYKVLLQRPAPLNKGFDFIVKIDGVYFSNNGKKRHQNPSHSDIVSSLMQVQHKISEERYRNVKDIINGIYELKAVDFTPVLDITFSDGDGVERPLVILLLAIKWLFLEQDITYWNFSGRAMLMNGLWEQKLA